ncbi:MAG: xanthine dehydrogenase family protein molybdopterin-binding subunit, partial [Reyranellales bacterium]
MAEIGTPVRRREDYRFLTGQGTYTDDINRPGQLYAYILRSPHAHARIAGLDTIAAAKAVGVAAVYTGKDLEADGIGGLPCGWQIHSKDGSPMQEPAHPVLAFDRVRHVGDPVAVVIADTLGHARDASELVYVDYAIEASVTNATEALKPSAPLVFAEVPGNVCYDWQLGDLAATDAALKSAARVVKLDLINNRLVPNAMEPRAAIGDFDRATGEHTLYTTSQNPHVIRLLMGAFVLHIAEAKLRVVAPDVGGGFGSKIYHYAEEAIVTWAAAKLKKPIKWTADRVESFMSDAHGRDHATHVELGLDAQNKFVALKVATIANMGAYLSTFATCIPTYLYGTLLAGTYTTPAIYVETKAVFTNTVPVDAYRGAGRPEATFLLERIVDLAADELGVDPAELRRKNFIPTDAYPYQTPVALQYDSGDYFSTLDLATKAADYAGFEARRTEAARRGKLRGIGIATYIEACGIAPSAVVGSLGARAGLFEAAAVRVHPTGSVTILTGSHSHGQGHETTFAQLVADGLGIPMESIEIVHGDTAKIPYGMGTYGSRSLAVGGTAIIKAMDKIIAKGKKIAAHLLEAAEADIEFKDGNFSV